MILNHTKLFQNKNPQILPPSILIHQQQHTYKQVINSVDEK
jgi:hypothetical protein